MFGFVGVKEKIIIIEVIKFLVIDVGVENILIMVKKNKRENRIKNERNEEKIGSVVEKVGK